MATGWWEEFDPRIEIRLSGSRDTPPQPLICLIDTGFTGSIQIPEGWEDIYGIVPNTTTEVAYGGLKEEKRPLAQGYAEIDGVLKTAAVIIGHPEQDPLLGVLFLSRFSLKLTIDPIRNLVELVEGEFPRQA